MISPIYGRTIWLRCGLSTIESLVLQWPTKMLLVTGLKLLGFGDWITSDPIAGRCWIAWCCSACAIGLDRIVQRAVHVFQLLRRMMNVIVKRQFNGTNQISLFRPMDVREKAATKRSGGLSVHEENDCGAIKKLFDKACKWRFVRYRARC